MGPACANEADTETGAAKVSFVCIQDVGVHCGEGLHPGHTYVIPTIEGSATLRGRTQLNLWAPKAKPIFHFL